MQQIELKILFFARAKELSKQSESNLILSSNELTFDELLNIIVSKYSLEPIKNILNLSLNENFCDKDSKLFLRTGDEIAVIPPLSGG